MWDLTGMQVRGIYLGEFPVSGRVELSRVKYGGTVQHTVALDRAVTVYGTVRDRVLLDHDQILQVADSRCLA